MLNRRLSDYLFFGSLALITIVVVLIRVLVIGSLNTKIDDTHNDNLKLQRQIDALEQLVQDYRDIQTSHLYELYDTIPNVYSSTNLTYRTVAILEQLGIDESDDYNRTVYVNETVRFGENSEIYDAISEYFVVRVEVTFVTGDIGLINEFIDAIYDAEQLFIIDHVRYVDTNNEYNIEIQVSFLAFYDVQTN